MEAAQRSGGIQPLLQHFFRFMHERTDFYIVDPRPKRPMGFAEGAAEALVGIETTAKLPPMQPALATTRDLLALAGPASVSFISNETPRWLASRPWSGPVGTALPLRPATFHCRGCSLAGQGQGATNAHRGGSSKNAQAACLRSSSHRSPRPSACDGGRAKSTHNAATAPRHCRRAPGPHWQRGSGPRRAVRVDTDDIRHHSPRACACRGEVQPRHVHVLAHRPELASGCARPPAHRAAGHSRR